MSEEDWRDKRFDPYMQQVGWITAIFSHLDFAVDQAIWEFANIEQATGACITLQIVSIGMKMNALISLVHFRGGTKQILKDYEQLSQKIQDLSRQRNRYVHDRVGININEELIRANMTASKRLNFNFCDVDIADMDKLVNKIRMTLDEFNQIHVRALAELPPWPRTQYELSRAGIRIAHRNGSSNNL